MARPDKMLLSRQNNSHLQRSNCYGYNQIGWDGKGGVVYGISDQFKIPVKYIGLGEGMEDLQVFRKKEFVDSLFGENA